MNLLPMLSILSPFISLMGYLINIVYTVLEKVNITSVAVTIIVFTVVIKVLMLPLTYKQQKFSRVSALMNPEIQEIQAKYKGKRDNDSMMKMQAEQQAVYKKYGTSPTSGCLPMIVIMLLLFALYPVIYSIPTYVKGVQTYYDKIVVTFPTEENVDDDAEICKNIPEKIYYVELTADEAKSLNSNIAIDDSEKKIDVVVAEKYSNSSEIKYLYSDKYNTTDDLKYYTFSEAIYSFYSLNGVYVRKAPKAPDGKSSNEYNNDNLIAIMAGFSADNWSDLYEGVDNYEDKGKIEATPYNLYAPYFKEALNKDYNVGSKTVSPLKVKNEIVSLNTFMTVNIFDKPAIKSITILIPLLAAIFQFAQTKLTMALSNNDDKKKKKKKDPNQIDPAEQMKMMNTIMPIFSGIICFSLPIGVGLYWITSSVVSIIIQIFCNIKLKNIETEVFVEEADSRNKKDLEKMGVHYENKGEMANLAKTSTKSISSNAKAVNSGKNKGGNRKTDAVIPEEKRHLKANSIAAIANIYSSNDSNDSDEENSDSEE